MKDLKEIYEKYGTSEVGLSNSEVQEGLSKYGLNELAEDKKDHPIKVFLMQFADILIGLLIVAAIAAYFIGDWIDSCVILIVVLVNAIIGFIQEYRAEKAMEKLKSLVSTEAVVRRDGDIQKVPGSQLTIGDIVIIDEGDKVPADMIFVETSDLKIDESSLTGESLAVSKNVDGIDLLNIDKNSHDEEMRKAVGYMDSNVISGRGTGIVIDIGMNTSIGKIAQIIQEDDGDTPLQEKISSLSKTLGLIAIVVCIIVFFLQYFQLTSTGVEISHVLTESFMTAVSLAVAAIPEGLPAVLTLTLALGMQQMAKSNAVVRKLLAVETLGSCTVVCTDKTGTLTLNKMTVRDARITNKEKSYEISALCNNAAIKDDKLIGDPTDAAVMLYGKDNGYEKLTIENTYSRIKEIPLDSVRKRMTTIHIKNNTNNTNNTNNINNKNGNNENNENENNKEYYIFTKGAPEIILSKSKFIDNEGKIEAIDDIKEETILKDINEMTNSALRVLGLGYKVTDDSKVLEDPDIAESDLVFVGLLGMMDPPREEAKKAVASCKTAGIKVVMITGDHQSTASAIAREIGILTDGKVLNGEDLDKLSDEEFKGLVEDVQVYARVFPEQKVRIVQALQSHGNIVSMTGDGVNDAPALKKASIGVAMGSGTDVSKESADMIIQDDDFATIIKAIKLGRKIFDNIKRFVKFQVSTNVGAILTIVMASLMSLPIPFNPVQILWINIMMDGPPAQSLGTEGAERNIMNRYPEKGNILTKKTLIKIALAGIVMAIGTLGLYIYELNTASSNPDQAKKIAMTVAFTVFVIYQLFSAINNRASSDEKNNMLWFALGISFILQLCVIYIPQLQGIFRTTAIGLVEWVLIIIVGAIILVTDRIVNKVIG